MTKTILLDVKRCSGCQACAVACMDQNDLWDREKEDAWRQIFTIEKGTPTETRISYLSLACMHCEDTPCLIGCPTGAIYKDQKIGAIRVRQEFCIGCHSCSLACPFGIPRFDSLGKMEKCHLCSERVAEGLEPACVRVCPTKALRFGEINELSEKTVVKAAHKILAAVSG